LNRKHAAQIVGPITHDAQSHSRRSLAIPRKSLALVADGQTQSGPVGKPPVDNLGDGIWEVRSRLDNRIARTLFAMVEQEIVLLHGFIKKQQKTPQDELELAKKRKRQYLQNL
jgi:phage-related protein